MITELSTDTLFLQVSAATATGTTAVTIGPVDLSASGANNQGSGFDAICYFLDIGTPNAGNNVKAQEGTKSDGSDMTDIANSHVTPGGSNLARVCIDVVKQNKRYSGLVITRAGATTTVSTVFAILYKAKNGLPFNNNLGSANINLPVFTNTLTVPTDGTA